MPAPKRKEKALGDPLMLAKKQSTDDPVFIVKLQKGLADRNRLPLEDVLTVLGEVRQMLSDAGRAVRQRQGLADSDVDFGLELVAGTRGSVFRKGSIQAHIALTADKANGLLAADLVLDTVKALTKGKLDPGPGGSPENRIIRRLNNIAKIHKKDKIDTQFGVRRPNQARATTATFGDAAVSYAKTLSDAEFTEDSVTVFGKLSELEDRDFDEEGGKDVFGELRHDTGETWRVQFKASDKTKARDAWGEQVTITGRVSYYRVASPKIEVESIEVDPERDYESSFDELFGCDRDAYKVGLDMLLEEIRGA